MNTVFTNGRKANEDGFKREANPCAYIQAGKFCPAARDQWFAGWDDAQIDREIWEDENHRRAA